MNGDGHWQQPQGHWQSPSGPPPTGAGGHESTRQWQPGPDMRWQQGGPYTGMHYQQDPGWQYRGEHWDGGGRQQGMATSLIVSLIVLVAVALAAVGAALYFVVFASSDDPPQAAEEVPPAVETVWETETAAPGAAASSEAAPTTTARPQAPAGASMCSDNGNDRHGRAAAGTSVTSCEFANAVRDAYVGSSVSGSGSISAYSPVTGQSYTMNCSGGEVVTCRGGNNAVVHIY